MKQYLSTRIQESLLSRIDQLAKQTRRTRSQVAEMLLEQSLKEDKMEPIFRQGDVLLRKVNGLPSGKRKKRVTGHVLEGEASSERMTHARGLLASKGWKRRITGRPSKLS